MSNMGQINTFPFKETQFSNGARSVSKIFHEVSFIKKFLQNKLRVNSLIIRNYDWYYTVNKNRKGKEEVEEVSFDISDYLLGG